MPPSSLNWDQLEYELTPWIKDAISSLGFESMTPVQASTIPLFSQNKDVIVEAVTGSGKTLAFVIPIIERIMKLDPVLIQKRHFNAVIVSPTRELSLQIEKVLQSVLKFNPKEQGIRTQVLVGGINSIDEDLRTFQKTNPQIIVATPGRLSEFLKFSNIVHTKNCEVLVLDEADKLLDLNFEKEMNNIFHSLPKQKRVGLFSATILNASSEFHKTGMRNPVKIVVNSKNHKPKTLKLNYHILKPENKINDLFAYLDTFHFRKSIIYFPTCLSVDYFYSLFKQLTKDNNLNDLKFYSLHGKLKTNSRIKTLEKFDSNNDSKSILMTTDVAARGIDIENVDLVIQLDPPTDPDVFLHRCGRTGRANNVGQAIVFLNEGREEDYIDFLQVRQIEVYDLEFNPRQIIKQEQITKWILVDRLRHDQAIRAYVSFIRYYSKHSASSIFRLQSFNYLSLAKMYGLIRLPRMPELTNYLKDQFPKDGYLDPSIDFSNYKYLDEAKELKRIEEEKEQAKRAKKHEKKHEKNKIDENSAWSKKVQRKVNKEERNAGKDIKKRELELVSSDDEHQETDWKDLVRQSKKEKKQKKEIMGDFDDL
ncbi:ATP-dependent rRNA helicase SPB4 [Wickerhamomyces ciferrii]|uniref:ATP-dependent RNA helicase n=1 Tax=Wickerhamomyces ciferrii (strain ATCC 14091 / BCRC 22168 / CBS 111 / JCM 3599 / NBRC 0793 / NRRL Y-1031 F-60-10) TaxID=1206466 RepID=K0KV38_WICCF|nr:ATP-dependent rRNA helicase SPB4 [Wickerhamomyces ciferrii]CCH45033.1 ATP-dependent rRNA helicase SPB4 [Wickerhamomyces ciferrii]